MRGVRGKTGARPVWAVSALLLALLLGLATPRPVAAGEFTITACQADSGGFASGAFEDFATRGMRWRRACNPSVPACEGWSPRTWCGGAGSPTAPARRSC